MINGWWCNPVLSPQNRQHDTDSGMTRRQTILPRSTPIWTFHLIKHGDWQSSLWPVEASYTCTSRSVGTGPGRAGRPLSLVPHTAQHRQQRRHKSNSEEQPLDGEGCYGPRAHKITSGTEQQHALILHKRIRHHFCRTRSVFKENKARTACTKWRNAFLIISYNLVPPKSNVELYRINRHRMC